MLVIQRSRPPKWGRSGVSQESPDMHGVLFVTVMQLIRSYKDAVDCLLYSNLRTRRGWSKCTLTQTQHIYAWHRTGEWRPHSHAFTISTTGNKGANKDGSRTYIKGMSSSTQSRNRSHWVSYAACFLKMAATIWKTEFTFLVQLCKNHKLQSFN